MRSTSGGAGFIGSNLVRHALETTTHKLVVVDKLTYATNRVALEAMRSSPRVDHCAAIMLVLKKGRLGESYNIGAANERSNLNWSTCCVMRWRRSRLRMRGRTRP